jgi:ribosomal protein L1
MDEDAFNLSIRKFLKHFGVTAQREIESTVRKAIEEGRLRGDEAVPVRATLVVDGILNDFHIDGTVMLAASPDAPAA